MTTVFINELHYENVGKDVKEGVEIAAPAGTNLDGWTVHLYNGNHGKVYSALKLQGIIPNLGNGWGVSFFSCTLTNPSDGTGLALVDAVGHVVQFLSYTAPVKAVDGPAVGKIAQQIPVKETIFTAVGLSLQLHGKGNKYEDFKWVGPAPSSYGKVNDGQQFDPVVPVVAPQGVKLDIDMQEQTNRERHHTDKFHSPEQLVLRRGDVFEFSLKTSSNLSVDHLALRFKGYPEGKSQVVKISEDVGEIGDIKEFTAFVSGAQGGANTKISVRIPSTAIVGEYLFSVSVDGGHTWSAESHIVILFNAWSDQDSVFMSEDADRKSVV